MKSTLCSYSEPLSVRKLRSGEGCGVQRLLSLAILVLVCLSAQADPNPPSIRSTQGAWPIRRQWTVEETHHYAEWVENIYRMKTKGNVDQRTAKLPRILSDPEMNLLQNPAFAGEGANPQLSTGLIMTLNSFVDCAKFTAIVPAYYAYRRALPWMSTHVVGVGADVRIAKHTVPTGFECSFTAGSVDSFFLNGIGGFISGNYRVEPNNTHSDWSDTVPVAIDRAHLLPGCINYTDGHCLLLGLVDKYGELHFLNASTTITRDIFTYNGMNTVSGLEPMNREPGENPLRGCFQGLRVLRYPIAETNAQGVVIRVRRRTDAEMREFGMSYEEYEKVASMYEDQRIMEDGLKFGGLHQFIRYRMKTVDQIAPLPFMKEYVQEMLEMYQERETFVQGAWQNVLHGGLITYPEHLDNDNIFQASGRWETWSSPSSDVDRRMKYFYLADWMDNAITWFQSAPKLVDLTGFEPYAIHTQEDLAKAVIAEKNKLFEEKILCYTNSAGKKIPLTLTDIEKRLYDLSFDPNHPPELRWGAPEGSEERATAKEMPTPVTGGAKVPMAEAYSLEFFYRTLCQRETESSSLRGMFTTGFPIRSKFTEQLSKWLLSDSAAPVAGASAP